MCEDYGVGDTVFGFIIVMVAVLMVCDGCWHGDVALVVMLLVCTEVMLVIILLTKVYLAHVALIVVNDVVTTCYCMLRE